MNHQEPLYNNISILNIQNEMNENKMGLKCSSSFDLPCKVLPLRFNKKDRNRVEPKQGNDDKNIVMEAVKKNGYLLVDASERLKDAKDVVMEAVKNYGVVLKFASERLRNDKDVAIAAVRNERSAWFYVSDRLKGDRDVVTEALNNADDYGRVYAAYVRLSQEKRDE